MQLFLGDRMVIGMDGFYLLFLGSEQTSANVVSQILGFRQPKVALERVSG